MIQTIYLDTKLDKQLHTLSRAGKKAALAAGQARDILRKLQSGSFSRSDAGAMTKHGESRIKGCTKYDLGSGYRLVTFMQGEDLLVLYVGNHDDCHRWIENNRELPVECIKQRSEVLPVEKSPAGEVRAKEDKKRSIRLQESEDDPHRLDDRQLRAIFSGLVASCKPDIAHLDRS